MKDFFKIFFIICALMGAFLFGRNYGEKNFKDSEEYKELVKNKDDTGFTKNELENVKTKFQNILDGSESKKSEELLGQILQVFLADLGLRLEMQKNFVKQCEPITTPPQVANTTPALSAQQYKNDSIARASRPPLEKKYDLKRLKSYEWILQNSRELQEVKKNLKNVEIKDIDAVMKFSRPALPQEQESIFGSYRGRIIDVTNNEYGTLVIEINSVIENQKQRLKGSFKIFKNGKENSSRGFSTDQLGYVIDGSTGFIIDNGNTYFQLYKINETQQIAGYYYDRMVNGTTKTIGSFVLNRVDQF